MNGITALAPPTDAQRAAIAVVDELSRTQAAELALRHYLGGTTVARADALGDAYRALHLAYGGRAPLSVTVPVTTTYFQILGDAPDVGERG